MGQYADALTSGISSAISSLPSTMANGLFGFIGAKQQYNSQKKLMNLQYKLNKQMWDLQNEYNLPVNQRARMEDAGLNPYLLNGSASTSASSMNGVSTPDAPNMLSGFDFQKGQQIGMQQGLVDAQREYYDAQSTLAYTRAETESRRPDLLEEQLVGLQLKNAQQRILNKYTDQREQAKLQQVMADIDQKSAQINMLAARTKLTDKQVERLDFELRTLLPKIASKYDMQQAVMSAQIVHMAVDNNYKQSMLRLYESGVLGGNQLQTFLRLADDFVNDLQNGTSNSLAMKIYNEIKKAFGDSGSNIIIHKDKKTGKKNLTKVGKGVKSLNDFHFGEGPFPPWF